MECFIAPAEPFTPKGREQIRIIGCETPTPSASVCTDTNIPAGVTRTGFSLFKEEPFTPSRPPEGDGENFYPRCLCRVGASEGPAQIPDRSFGVSGEAERTPSLLVLLVRFSKADVRFSREAGFLLLPLSFKVKKII